MPKQNTLSAKQLAEKNAARLQQSTYIAFTGPAVAWLLYLVYNRTNAVFYWTTFGTIINVLSRQWLISSSKSGYTDLADCETTSDLLITTTLCLILGGLSVYFWVLWMWLPVYLFYKLWIGYIWPWITAVPPEKELTDKQRKKMEKKQRQKVKFQNF